METVNRFVFVPHALSPVGAAARSPRPIRRRPIQCRRESQLAGSVPNNYNDYLSW